MAVTASIIIEVDDTAAVGALNRVKAEAAAIAPAIAPIQQASTRAFNQVAQDTQRARESTMLLRDEFGIAIPRALRSTIAEASLIGPLMTTAFSGLAVMAFANIAVMAGEKLAGFIDKAMGWSEMSKKINDAAVAMNFALTQSIGDTAQKVDALQKAYELIGLTGLPLFSKKQQQVSDDLDAAKKKVLELTDALLMQQKVLTAANVAAATGPVSPMGAVASPLSANPAAAEAAQANINATAQALLLARDAATVAAAALKNAGKETEDAFSKEKEARIKSMADATLAFATAQQEAVTKVMAMNTAAKTAMAGPEEQINIELRAKQEELAKFLSYYGEDETMRSQAALASVNIEKEASAKRIALLTDEADKIFAIEQDADAKRVEEANATAEKLRRMEDQTLNIERIAAVGMVPPWERANATIVANYQERMAKIAELVKTGDLDEQHAARQQTAAMQELFAQQRDLLATQMETLYNDITSGNIGKAFLAMFRKMVFEMVATWILGMQGMRAASGQAMGGGGGGILGAIFGGGGSGGAQGGISSIPGVITNFGVASSNADLISAAGGMSLDNLPLGGGELAGMAPLIGIGLSAGMGGGAIGTTLPSGAGPAGTAAAAAGLGGILTKIFPHGISIGGTTISGTMLATLGIGLVASSFGKGGVLGVLGSAAGGALTGFAFDGPVGAAIGGIIGGLVGLFSSLFGQHKGDKARIQVMEPLIAQIKILKDSYDVFQTPYNTGISQLETLRSNAIAGLRAIGGRQVHGNTDSTNRLVDAAEAYLNTTEAERARRGQLAFGPPQFRTGGLVGPGSGAPVPSWFAGTAMHFAGGGAVPAFLHQGEFVMRPEAVQRYGAANLARMNAGGGGGEVHNHYHINALDAKSVVELFRRMQSEGAW
jgi:hypothetical protein